MITVLVLYPPLCLATSPCTILPLALHHLPTPHHISGTPGQVTGGVLLPHTLPVLGTIVLEGEHTGRPTVGVATNCAPCTTVPPCVQVTPPVPPCVSTQCTPQGTIIVLCGALCVGGALVGEGEDAAVPLFCPTA